MQVRSISVVVPALNEADNIRQQVEKILAALRDAKQMEIIYVDDGSDDNTASELVELVSENPQLRYIRHLKRYGQSTALLTGIRAAKFRWIATLDGDGQNEPEDIPRLYGLLQSYGAEGKQVMISGWRQSRQDNWLRRVSSRFANKVRQALLKDTTPDSGCGIKLFSRELFLSLPYFDHMHRFLPALVLRAGGRVVSEPVSHYPRTRGTSKYGLSNRLWAGVYDLIGVAWLLRRSRLPVIVEYDSADGTSTEPENGDGLVQ